MTYVDGFILPVKTARKDDYIKAAQKMTALYLAHGAARCVETWGAGLEPGQNTSFPRAVELADDETAVFAWMEFPDKATSDAAHRAVWSDPDTEKLMGDGLVDGQRMIMGGFEILLDVT
ncbi:DUF1428 domain-containing protein [Jannaschia sp. CCS1]|uniref:DUF1428 domain-containing protein n=1 Tax=Jannaschia sp. (strain CCS1) TaxID=290400 RepID=UPI000053A6EE|nr:DUF1428 domain-containing protein [Jannaschia sp. CCS1]ABD54355.1 hypothetical protein Jann_1438 [Jannaschia sp. CCS1]